jgi:predicted PurR-regulated permease PerM
MQRLSYSLLNWLGGSIGRAAGTGLIGGAILLVSGMTPAELVAYVAENPPEWLTSGWTRLFLVIVGLALLFVSIRYNIWSQRQRVVDSLSEEISWAIHNLLNRPFPKFENQIPGYIEKWEQDYKTWCAKVNGILSNRAFFTLSDQLHFDRLGFIDPITMTGRQEYDWWLSQLKLKFERLRDIINWTQQRTR